MDSPEESQRRQDTGPSLTAIAALQELRRLAIAQIKPLNQIEPLQAPTPVTGVQLLTLVDSAAKLRSIIIYQDFPGRKTEDGRTIREKKQGPFRVTSIGAGENKRRNARTLVVWYHEKNFPTITLTFYETVKKGHEFDLEVNYGLRPQLNREEPIAYSSGRKKRENMDTYEYEVASDLLMRAEKVFPNGTTLGDSQT